MYWKIIGISLFALLAQHLLKLFFLLDFGKHVYNHLPGPCHQVEGMGFGSENMFSLANGITFITSGFRLRDNSQTYDKFYNDNKIKGRIYIFDFKNPKKIPREMTLTSTENFQVDKFSPHGISGWEDKKSGRLYLFVVNHEQGGQEKVEKFIVSMEKMSLTYVKSYTGEGTFKLLNDVVATGEDSFYFTNYHSVTSKLGRTLTLLALMPWEDVGYFDGNYFRIVVHGLLVANGIDMSKDGRYVYVTPSTGKELRIYERNPDNSLHLREIYPLHSFPDNVLVDPVSGDLYIGLHPIGHKVMLTMDDPSVKGPSQVLQVKLKNGAVSTVQELLMDDGNIISASSVATVYNKKMLIGSILDKLVYCDVTVPL